MCWDALSLCVFEISTFHGSSALMCITLRRPHVVHRPVSAQQCSCKDDCNYTLLPMDGHRAFRSSPTGLGLTPPVSQLVPAALLPPARVEQMSLLTKVYNLGFQIANISLVLFSVAGTGVIGTTARLLCRRVRLLSIAALAAVRHVMYHPSRLFSAFGSTGRVRLETAPQSAD